MEKQNYHRKIFRDRLNKLMIEREIANVKLAKSLDVSTALISKYTAGKASPSFENLLKLGEFFDVSLDYLTGRRNTFKEDSDISQQVHNVLLMVNNIKKKNPEENKMIEKLKVVADKMSQNLNVQENGKLMFQMVTLMEMLEINNLEMKRIMNEMKDEIMNMI